MSEGRPFHEHAFYVFCVTVIYYNMLTWNGNVDLSEEKQHGTIAAIKFSLNYSMPIKRLKSVL